jgi:hypothetical protein
MKTKCTWLLLLILTASPLAAGVVFEVETKDHGQSPPQVETHQMAAEGKMLKMGIAGGGRSSEGEMIYRGDRREMVVVNHDDKTYFVLDEAGLRRLADQVGGAMAQIQEALKNVPESQRKMVEEMMKKRMPQAAAVAKKVIEVRNTGERADQAGYPCVKYEILSDGSVSSELWVTGWDHVQGGEEAAAVFKDMAGFFHEMMEAFQSASGPMGGFISDLGNATFEHMRQIDGFPVVTRQLDGGKLESESTLRSAERRSLEPGDFEPPAGYKRRDMSAP